MTIIFYDIPSNLPENAWSPNTWKVRFVLNYKKIPHRTEWIEFPDIAEHCKKLGIPPSSIKADGTPYYSVPAIHDTSTGVYLSDSFPIVEYLERTYPDAPTVFPHGTHGLQMVIENVFRPAVISKVIAFIIHDIPPSLHPRSAAYARELPTGKALKRPEGDEAFEAWAKFKDGLGEVDKWYAKSGGPFLMGETASWADLYISAWLIWMRIIWGEDSAQWKDVASWQGGRWKALLDDLKEYQTVL